MVLKTVCVIIFVCINVFAASKLKEKSMDVFLGYGLDADVSALQGRIGLGWQYYLHPNLLISWEGGYSYSQPTFDSIQNVSFNSDENLWELNEKNGKENNNTIFLSFIPTFHFKKHFLIGVGTQVSHTFIIQNYQIRRHYFESSKADEVEMMNGYENYGEVLMPLILEVGWRFNKWQIIIGYEVFSSQELGVHIDLKYKIKNRVTEFR